MLPGQKRLLLAASHSPLPHIATLQITATKGNALCDAARFALTGVV